MCGPNLGRVHEISFDESASYFLSGVIVELINIIVGIDFCLSMECLSDLIVWSDFGIAHVDEIVMNILVVEMYTSIS